MDRQVLLYSAIAFWALVAVVLVAYLVARNRTLARNITPSRRKSRRRKSSFWKNVRGMIGTVAKVIGIGARKVASAGWFVLSHLPGWIGKVLKWIASKIATLIGLLFVLAIYGVAMALALTALNIGAHTEYAGLVIVEFFKWGLLVIAAVIALAATLPLFGIVKRLVN